MALEDAAEDLVACVGQEEIDPGLEVADVERDAVAREQLGDLDLVVRGGSMGPLGGVAQPTRL